MYFFPLVKSVVTSTIKNINIEQVCIKGQGFPYREHVTKKSIPNHHIFKTHVQCNENLIHNKQK